MQAFVLESESLMREMLIDLLQNKLSIEVIGATGNGQESLDLLLAYPPDILIAEPYPDATTGYYVISELTLRSKNCPPVVFLCNTLSARTLYRIDQLNPRAVIDRKVAGVEEIQGALRHVSNGRYFFSASIRYELSRLKADPNAFYKILSLREQQILTLVGGGFTDSQIGTLLCISEVSVQQHRKNLNQKLSCRSRLELLRYATQHGFWLQRFAEFDTGYAMS